MNTTESLELLRAALEVWYNEMMVNRTKLTQTEMTLCEAMREYEAALLRAEREAEDLNAPPVSYLELLDGAYHEAECRDGIPRGWPLGGSAYSRRVLCSVSRATASANEVRNLRVDLQGQCMPTVYWRRMLAS